MANWPDPCPLVAAHGLPGSRLAPPDEPLDPSAWAHVIACIEHERLTGLLAQAIADGTVPVTEEQAEESVQAHRASMARAVLLEQTLLRIGSMLDANAIDYRVLKGTAVAHLDYPDPGLRSFGDVDLLVRSAQFDAAVDVLVGAGHRRKFPEPRPGFDRRFGKGSCLVSPAGDELDLHRTFAMGPFGMSVRLEDLWLTPSAFRLAGRDLPALGREQRFLHACFHAALGDTYPRLSALRDVAQMQLSAGLDHASVRRFSARWGADAVVARAIRLTCDILGLEPDGDLAGWALAFEPDRSERRSLAVYLDSSPTYAAKSFAAIRSARGLRNKAAFVFGLAFPRRRYLDERHEGALHRWHRGIRQVTRSARRRGR